MSTSEQTSPPPLHTVLDLNTALQAAAVAARVGAAVLQSYANHRADLIIDHKGHNDLVSQADREAEAAIIHELRSRTPDYGIVAEETGGSVCGPATWYIDPLDGTTNFLQGIPHYAVSIGLIARQGTYVGVDTCLEEDTPVVAVVYDPNREELFHAEYGTGARLNGSSIRCSRTEQLKDALLATGFPCRDFSFSDQYMPGLHQAIKACRGLRRLGASSLELAWTAAGRYEGYWEMHLAPWDVAAGTLLVREAGGIVEDIYGIHPWPISGNVLCGNRSIAPALKQMIGPYLKKAAGTHAAALSSQAEKIASSLTSRLEPLP